MTPSQNANRLFARKIALAFREGPITDKQRQSIAESAAAFYDVDFYLEDGLFKFRDHPSDRRVASATAWFERKASDLIHAGIGKPSAHDLARLAVSAADRFEVEFTYDREGNFTFHTTGGPR